MQFNADFARTLFIEFVICCKMAFYAGIEDDMPDFNLDDLIQEAEAEFAPLVAESKEMAAQADKEIEKLEKELQTLDHLQVRFSFFPDKLNHRLQAKSNFLSDKELQLTISDDCRKS